MSDVPDPVRSPIRIRTRGEEPTGGERLDALFRKHSKELFRFFLRKTGGDGERAEDLVQEVFLSAATDVDRRGEGTQTLAWLYTVAHRRFVDDLRHTGRQPATVPFDEELFSQGEPPKYGDEVAEALRLVVRDLPATQRRVFVWKVLEGRSFKEIGLKIGTSEGAARMHLLRALQSIRESLEALGMDP